MLEVLPAVGVDQRGKASVQVRQLVLGDRAAEPVDGRPAAGLHRPRRARGLGTTITGYHLNGHQADVAALLGIPGDVTQVALLPVAYTTTTDFHPAARPLIEAITYYDHWGRTKER